MLCTCFFFFNRVAINNIYININTSGGRNVPFFYPLQNDHFMKYFLFMQKCMEVKKKVLGRGKRIARWKYTRA